MAMLGFVRSESEKLSISGIRGGVETGSFVDSEDIIGRDDEKKRVIDFVYNELYADRSVSLISIVGIGGMGKSALAQLVYNDANISADFSHRYWACISDISDEKEVLAKINQSMSGQGMYQDLSLDKLQSSIRKSVDRNAKFLLVLDDLWDEDMSRGNKLWSILSSDNAKGSKIIITTRNLSVAKAMRADEILDLKGLSWDKSWALFRRYAFSKDRENDPAWISIGEKIASKCSNVPLAIKSIASLLRVKDTIGEWRSLENDKLSKIQVSDDPMMTTLRLSYDHLPSYLKNCFAYCSLFPKDYMLNKKSLIYLWIAQGYIFPKEGETLEMTGNACFMELFRRSFFQEPEYDAEKEIKMCKMHDLIHDLAEDVAGDESCIITSQGKGRCHDKIRHVCVVYANEPSDIDNPLLLLNADRIRTSLYTTHSCSLQFLDEQFTKFRFLRALDLRSQRMDKVPSSIGEMKYLRYLDLSSNKFTHLPDSTTKLVNLITLDVGYCRNLVKLPRDIGVLVSLRHLINQYCKKLRCMPPTFGELTSLEHLSEFRATKKVDAVVDWEFCELNALGRLNIRGSMVISFDDGVKWSRDELLLERGHVPNSVETLKVEYYPSMRMPAWWRDINPASGLPKLEHLHISCSRNVKHLPLLRCLPCLRSLNLFRLPNMEFIEDGEFVATTPFFPSLCKLRIECMENLKGWSRQPTDAIFPCLSELNIFLCPDLLSLHINAPHLKSLNLYGIRAEMLDELVSGPCASGVEKIVINNCFDLSNFPGEGLTSLRSLEIINCSILSKVRVAPNSVEEFSIYRCPNMEFWEETENDEMCVDWSSFANLRLLTLDTSQEESINFPECLQQLVLMGKLCVLYEPPTWTNCMQGEVAIL